MRDAESTFGLARLIVMTEPNAVDVEATYPLTMTFLEEVDGHDYWRATPPQGVVIPAGRYCKAYFQQIPPYTSVEMCMNAERPDPR